MSTYFFIAPKQNKGFAVASPFLLGIFTTSFLKIPSRLRNILYFCRITFFRLQFLCIQWVAKLALIAALKCVYFHV